jgi:hypothetical protein
MELDIEELPDEVAIAEQIRRAIRGGAKSIKEMLDAIPDTRGLVLLTVFRCLGAHTKYFVKGDPVPKIEHDFKIQLEASKLLMSYQDGLPVQSIAATLTPGKPGEMPGSSMLEAARTNRAVRESVRALLDDMELADNQRSLSQ